MKKRLVLLLLSSPLYAGTMNTYGQLMSVTMSSNTAAATGSISVPQCVHGGQYNGTGTTISISPTNGNTLIVGFDISGQNSANFTSLKDNNNNSFTQDNSGWIVPTTSNSHSFFHLSNVSGVTGVVTAFNTNTIYSVVICEVSGLAASPVDVMDNTGSYQTAVTAWTTPSVTTNHAVDIVFGTVGNTQGNAFSTSAPWTLGATDDEAGSFDGAMVYQIVASATGYQPAGSCASSYVSGVTASYKATP